MSENIMVLKKGYIRSEETRKKLSESHKGKRLSEEQKRKISEALKGKPKIGHKWSEADSRRFNPPGLGRHRSEDAKRRISIANSGPNNGMYRNDAKYRAIHVWVNRRLKKPDVCPICRQQSKRMHLANITGIYNRILVNWVHLCPKCHVNLDRGNMSLNSSISHHLHDLEVDMVRKEMIQDVITEVMLKAISKIGVVVS